jgi:hypothetical protein
MGKRKLTDAQEAEICQRYLAGETTTRLGPAFGISAQTANCVLKRNGITARTNSEARGGLSADAEAQMCGLYLQGQDAVQLGAAFGVSPTCIRRLLKRNGITTRNRSEAQGGLSADAAEEVCRRYLAGENTMQLGAEFGVTPATLGCLLERHGIERRRGSAYGDSVQHILDNTGYHTCSRECEFYLYELARYRDTHCKPGIAFDADRRVDAEYGAEALRLFFDTRTEAYFLEQAVLDATRGYSDCPADLSDWGGASEIRAMPAEDLLPVIDRLATELELMGVWDFAAAYVPMTAAQRAQCQQRAAQEAPVERG